ncbi:hypothetical protein [Microcoleus sp. herbarium14]|uniref:hypothetical protein n=1 Tax=Microcoleus sp. herbarium14 TaxID=3055439 RepID=UPI002FCEAA2F
MPKWQHSCAIVPDNLLATQKKQADRQFMLPVFDRRLSVRAIDRAKYYNLIPVSFIGYKTRLVFVSECRHSRTHSLLSSTGLFNFEPGLEASMFVPQIRLIPPGLVGISSVVGEPIVNIFS